MIGSFEILQARGLNPEAAFVGSGSVPGFLSFAMKSADAKQTNQSLLLNVRISIGAKKKEEAANSYNPEDFYH